jgi:undecaprenyl-diphosphatase
MRVFDWEIDAINVARKWPQDGIIHQFFHFWTDFSESRWLLILFVIGLTYRIGWHRIIPPCLLVASAVGMGDLTSRRIVKALLMRPRPNYLGLDCSMSPCWGFVSSHATNITAAAVVLCLYDKRNLKWTWPVVLIVCFSRFYLCDHFPLDVLCGMTLGGCIGFFIFVTWKLFREWSRNSQLLPESKAI